MRIFAQKTRIKQQPIAGKQFSINPIRLGQPAGRFGKTPDKARIDFGNRQALGDHRVGAGYV
ncbi:hypothetical protein [Rhizobium tibeticum]|uniref:hypothetical protein n=1 Tax=Rhizobium tibeticum TaxID=501024 RepID=UPI001FCD8B10|nr:hypothetical protein [Rhizobium tibeticum]